MNAEQHADNITKLTTRKDIINYIRAVEAAAVAAEREANCAAVCPFCAGILPEYKKAELINGLWEHRNGLGKFDRVPCDAAAIRARSNGNTEQEQPARTIKRRGDVNKEAEKAYHQDDPPF